MSAAEPDPAHTSGPAAQVCVRFWASARAAAGVAEVQVEVPGRVGLDELVGRVLDQLVFLGAERPGLERVLAVCSVLVGDRPAGSAERAGVEVVPGDTVEFLPPFAGG